MRFPRSVLAAVRTTGVLAALVAVSVPALATLVVPPQYGYWGAFHKLKWSLEASALVFAVTPDTTLDDPGPAGEEGRAALVLHVPEAAKPLVSSILQDHYLVAKEPDRSRESAKLRVPLRVESGELVEVEGTLRAIPWLSGDFPLAAHDYELVLDSGETVPVYPAGSRFLWPGPTNPALGQGGEVPARLLVLKSQLADTVVPHNPARDPKTGLRPVFLAVAAGPKGSPLTRASADPVDGVELVKSIIGHSYAVAFVTPDHRAGTPDPTRVLVTLNEFERETNEALLKRAFTYKGTAYTIETRVTPEGEGHTGRLVKTAQGHALEKADKTLPVVFSAHWTPESLAQYLNQATEIEGYVETVAGTSVLFAIYVNVAQE